MSNHIGWVSGMPKSLDYDDVFFSSSGALDEKQHVFIDQSKLLDRAKHSASVSVVELGFGFGINFMLSLKALTQNFGKRTTLEYVGIENHMPSIAHLKKLYQQWPKMKPYYQALLRHYPARTNGVFTFAIPEYRCRLTLMIGDVSWALSEITGPIDVWYLDGFSPLKNPRMWSYDIMGEVYKKTAQGGCAVTYSCAGSVKRGLLESGFELHKNRGYAAKKHQLLAIKTQAFDGLDLPSWYQLPKRDKTSKVAVIGAGISGMSTALALNEYGVEVDVFDQECGQTRSRLPWAMLKPVVHRQPNAYADYYNHGHLYTRSWIEYFCQYMDGFETLHSGLLELSPKTFEPIDHPYVEYEGIEKLVREIGLSEETPAYLLPTAMVVSVSNFIQAMRSFCQDKIKTYHLRCPRAYDLNQSPWVEYDAVVVTAWDVAKCLFDDVSFIRHQVGQLTNVYDSGIHLPIPISYGGTAIPLGGGQFQVGATYRAPGATLDRCIDDDQYNLQQFCEGLSLGRSDQFSCATAYVGKRTVSHDHMPLIGPAMCQSEFSNQFSKLKQGDLKGFNTVPNYMPRVYLSLAHGSQGLNSSMLAGQHVAQMLLGRNLCMGRTAYQACHPNRFYFRSLKSSLTP